MRGVFAEIRATVAYPFFFPVTLTEIRSRRSDALSLYVFFVAAAIGFPFRYHWYANVVPDVHCPCAAVSTWPDRVVPRTRGAVARSALAVAADERVVVAYPLRVPTSFTAMGLPA
jgi:hypothetical protein